MAEILSKDLKIVLLQRPMPISRLLCNGQRKYFAKATTKENFLKNIDRVLLVQHKNKIIISINAANLVENIDSIFCGIDGTSTKPERNIYNGSKEFEHTFQQTILY